MKKMTLFRGYQTYAGMDLSWIYDPDNIFDAKKRQEQEEWLDNHSLEEIANLIDDKINEIKATYVDNSISAGTHVSEGVDELLESLKQTPEIGYPLFGKYVNAVVRGARLKKFYLRSAATGVGKTRSMIADACYIGCSQMYNTEKNAWESTGMAESVLYIATEQPLDEIQTMCIAFIAGVNEEHILTGGYFAENGRELKKRLCF
jgi:replicative DNA helicase